MHCPELGQVTFHKDGSAIIQRASMAEVVETAVIRIYFRCEVSGLDVFMIYQHTAPVMVDDNEVLGRAQLLLNHSS